MNNNKSLELLEKNVWPPVEHLSNLVSKVHQLRKVPVGMLTIENLRLLIGQKAGLSYLIPLALEKLEHDLFAEGDFYEGDLLKAVLSVDETFWGENPAYKKTLDRLTQGREVEIYTKLKLRNVERGL